MLLSRRCSSDQLRAWPSASRPGTTTTTLPARRVSSAWDWVIRVTAGLVEPRAPGEVARAVAALYRAATRRALMSSRPSVACATGEEAYSIAMLLAVTVFVLAGNWQRSRMQGKEALRAQYDALSALPPRTLPDLAPSADFVLPSRLNSWR